MTAASKKFEKVLAIHCHTTGVSKGDDITANNQPLTVALGLLNTSTLKFEETVSVQIKFDSKKYTWDSRLEDIHGITSDLRDDGETFEDAAAILGEFIYKHFGVKDSIPVFGYRANSFHIPFLNKVFHSVGLHFKFDDRALDLFPLMAVMGQFSSRDMFDFLEIDQSQPLSSLYIIKEYLKVYRMFRTLIQTSL